MRAQVGITVRSQVHFRSQRHGRKEMKLGDRSQPLTPGRAPRVARLMALAVKLEQLLREGHLRDYAEIARLGHVTRARVTQVMNLLNLAPDIQEQVLSLDHIHQGRDPVTERDLRPLVSRVDWARQRALWRTIHARPRPSGGGHLISPRN